MDAVLDVRVPALPVLFWFWLCLLKALTFTYVHPDLEPPAQERPRQLLWYSNVITQGAPFIFSSQSFN